MDLKNKISYSIVQGKLKPSKKISNLKTRKLKNAQHKELVNIIKERKKESEAAPINYYKKQGFYKSKNLKDRRKYNQTFRTVYKQSGDVDPEKHRFLIYRESLPKGTSLNGIKDVNLNYSPLYYPDSTKEDESKRKEGIEAWTKLKKEWGKSDSKKRFRRKSGRKGRK